MIDKKVEKEQLPRGVQVKIEKLQEIYEKISEYDNENDLDDEEQGHLEKLKKGAEALNDDIERSILKFDPEKYKKKLEVMMEVRAKRKQGNNPPPAKVSKPTPEPVQEEQEHIVEQKIAKVRQNAEVVPDELELCEDCEEDLRNGRLTLSEIEAAKKRRDFDEEEEFEKVSNAKPRKLSTSVIMMGIGAFILTWGAVNFFRERRG
jgi:hypothetical protein